MDGVKLLDPASLKSVLGGSGTCAARYTIVVFDASTNSTTTQWIEEYDIDITSAKNLVAFGGNWCCDSCDIAPWYNPPMT